MTRSTIIVALLCGIGFGFGLAYSTMIRPEVVLAFLRGRDFGLLLVLGGALAVTVPTYQLLPKLLRRPLLGGAFGKHQARMNRRTIGGAALFGLGWGIAGVCPGPAIAGLGTGNGRLAIATAAMFLGAYVQGRVAVRPGTDRGKVTTSAVHGAEQ